MEEIADLRRFKHFGCEDGHYEHAHHVESLGEAPNISNQIKERVNTPLVHPNAIVQSELHLEVRRWVQQANVHFPHFVDRDEALALKLGIARELDHPVVEDGFVIVESDLAPRALGFVELFVEEVFVEGFHRDVQIVNVEVGVCG